MSARILIVDDNPLNVKLLAAKLARDYYIISTAENGVQALEQVAKEKPDLILLDVMMPEMDGFETCKRLKADPTTVHIPVVMVTALNETADRVNGLQCGADDFLTKPINDVALMARVRSLLRLKMLMDEWRLREASSDNMITPIERDDGSKPPFNILLLEDDSNDEAKIRTVLSDLNPVIIKAEDVPSAVTIADENELDLVIASITFAKDDTLYLCAQLRARDKTRTLPILMIAHEGDIDRVAKALDLGANDYINRPLEAAELTTRVNTQVRQKRHYDRMRQNYEQSLTLALVDPLTGAFNRRYLDTNMPKMFSRYQREQKTFSVLSFDIDHFKNINDTYGHAAGDVVLKEIVQRALQSFRPMDMVTRMGGEEFAVIMPDIDAKTAAMVGERLRKKIADTPIALQNQPGDVSVTTSIGVATVDFSKDSAPDPIFERADAALYRAKSSGRNRVVIDGV